MMGRSPGQRVRIAPNLPGGTLRVPPPPAVFRRQLIVRRSLALFMSSRAKKAGTTLFSCLKATRVSLPPSSRISRCHFPAEPESPRSACTCSWMSWRPSPARLASRAARRILSSHSASPDPPFFDRCDVDSGTQQAIVSALRQIRPGGARPPFISHTCSSLPLTSVMLRARPYIVRGVTSASCVCSKPSPPFPPRVISRPRSPIGTF